MTELEIKSTSKLSLEEHFKDFEQQATEWSEKAKSIIVEDVSQTDLMKQAREARLILRDVRLGVEKKHKELKADALTFTQMLDSIKRKLVGLIEPIEEHLMTQEKFIEIHEEKRIAQLRVKRTEALRPYMGDQADKMQLGELEEETFNSILEGQKSAFEERKRKEQEEKQRLEQEEQERSQLESKKNIRVRQLLDLGLRFNGDSFLFEKGEVYINFHHTDILSFNDERWNKEFEKATIVVNKFNEEAKLKAEEEAIEREKIRIDNERLKKEQFEKDQKLALEKAARQKLEREKAEREEAERKQQEEKLKAERKEKRLPDAKKLLALSEQIQNIQLPDLKEKETQEISIQVKGLLLKVSDFINKKVKEL